MTSHKELADKAGPSEVKKLSTCERRKATPEGVVAKTNLRYKTGTEVDKTGKGRPPMLKKRQKGQQTPRQPTRSCCR